MSLRHRIKKKYPDLAATRFRIYSVFKNFHSGERIQNVADSYAGFSGYVWTEAMSGKKKLRIQKYPDTCLRGLREGVIIIGCFRDVQVLREEIQCGSRFDFQPYSLKWSNAANPKESYTYNLKSVFKIHSVFYLKPPPTTTKPTKNNNLYLITSILDEFKFFQ